MEDRELADLRHRYPAWHARRPPNASYLIATRRGSPRLSDAQLTAGLCMTLIEDTVEALQESLAFQHALEQTLPPPASPLPEAAPALPGTEAPHAL